MVEKFETMFEMFLRFLLRSVLSLTYIGLPFVHIYKEDKTPFRQRAVKDG